MIKDKLENIGRYTLNEFFEIFKTTIETTGKYPEQLQAPLKAIPLEYETKDFDLTKFETHKKNIDVHFIIQGSETIGITPVKNLNKTAEYNDEDDYQLFEGKVEEAIDLEEGDFLILFADEAHVTGGIKGNPEKLKKIVYKIPFFE